MPYSLLYAGLAYLSMELVTVMSERSYKYLLFLRGRQHISDILTNIQSILHLFQICETMTAIRKLQLLLFWFCISMKAVASLEIQHDFEKHTEVPTKYIFSRNGLAFGGKPPAYAESRGFDPQAQIND